jgi:hypothetical protein
VAAKRRLSLPLATAKKKLITKYFARVFLNMADL